MAFGPVIGPSAQTIVMDYVTFLGNSSERNGTTETIADLRYIINVKVDYYPRITGLPGSIELKSSNFRLSLEFSKILKIYLFSISHAALQSTRGCK